MCHNSTRGKPKNIYHENNYRKSFGVPDGPPASQLVTGQYEFLMGQLEKMLKDYFELSSKVKEMHAEVISLREELLEALSLRCRLKECERREAI